MILAQAFARFAIDLDGVVWTGDDPIPGAAETVRSLRQAGKRLCFVTNNSSETAETYAKRLTEIGAGADADEVVSSADATVRLLERAVPGLRGRLVLVIGGEGLRTAVAGLGLRIADGEEGADASVVVVGLDRDLTYEKLRLGTHAIRRGATFVASNADATFPAPEGLRPGAGTIVAALRAATGVEPLLAGKPEPTMLEVARERLGGDPALAIGDRVETDVLAARAAGWPSALVLSGATGVPELAAAAAWPDYVLRHLTDLLEERPHPQVRAAVGPDLPAIAALLHAGGLMSGAARERVGRTVVAEVDRAVIGTAAWELIGDRALLRSVAVSPERRSSGIGTVAAAAALRRIAEAGMREVFLATASAEGFFASCGFRTVPRDGVPHDVLRHPQVAREWPADASVMRLLLPAHQP